MLKSPFWLWPNILGLDAPCIAILWQDAFGRAFQQNIGWPERAGLFGIVWAIYLGDRMLDGIRLRITERSAARHRFAAQHSWINLGLLIVALAGSAYAAFSVPWKLLLGASAIGVSSGFYFLWNQTARGTFFRRYFKEFVIALIFVLGVLLVPVFQGAGGVSFFIAGVLFFALCLSNCAMISRLEREVDIARGEESYAVHFSRDLKPARWISAMAAIGAGIVYFTGHLPLMMASLIVLSGVGLWCTALIERVVNTRFSVVWVDLCLMTPLVACAYRLL